MLALPKNEGFNLAAYLVPIAVVLAAAALIVFTLTRRRRPRRPAPTAAAPEMSPAEARRLDEDLARFD